MINLDVNWPPDGRHILAVSGGADSMALLDIMASAAGDRGYDLIVAHFDHGMRSESGEDRKFVQAAALRLGLPFEHHEGLLGQASEATARDARHKWLEEMRVAREADTVITAHHQDDLLETSLLNLARGTGRRGLAPMSQGKIMRPLLGVSRASLRDYAAQHKITWREDPTNADTSNPRNYLRHKLLPNARHRWRSRYLELMQSMAVLNTKMDQSISGIIDNAQAGEGTYSFPRNDMRDMSISVLEEVLVAAAHMLCPGVELDRRVVYEIALFAKTARPGRHRPLRDNLLVAVQTDSVRVYYMGISKVGRR